MEEETLYLRMKMRIQANPHSVIKIGDVAQLIGRDDFLETISDLPIHVIKSSDHNIVIVDVMKVIATIQKLHPHLDIQTIGRTETIIDVAYKRKRPTIVFIALVWFLLFIGSGIAIMNFHEDVSMQKVHQQLFYLITGEELKKPLLLQIPYSFGLGIGMIIFFNHFFRKRLNEEPSPLEIEMFKYQQDLDQYVIIKEKKEEG